MIEDYTQKVFFVKDSLLQGLKDQSVTQYNEFVEPDLDTVIIRLPIEDQETKNEIVKYVDSAEVKAGNVLVREQYSNRFVKLESFSKGVALRKFQLWNLLCVALGAKSVRVDNVEELSVAAESSSSTDADAKIGAGLGTVDAEYKRAAKNREENMKAELTKLSVVAAGGSPNLEKAMEILRKNGLEQDETFRNIYEMRAISTNEVMTYTFDLDFSSDVSRIFDSSMMLKLDLLSKVGSFSASGNYEGKKSLHETLRTAVKVSVSVDF